MSSTKPAQSLAPKYLTGYLVSQSTKPRIAPVELGDFLVVGRDPSSGLCLPDPYISQRHLRIEKRPEGFALTDLRSRNGTFVNRTRIHQAVLNHLDVLRIGETELQFRHHLDIESPQELLKSKNQRWQAELDRVTSMAVSPWPVLLNGSSGTGKEVLARLIHRLSPRSSAPFVSVNCSAISENLVESELFGHIKGSFTGAVGDRKGAFEVARGGTLFLDEIGDLSLSLQPKLLRALENQEIRPVGSDSTIKTDVRILAATHRDLRLLVREGRFREDLYYRLNVLKIKTPDLKDRLEDFETLLYNFARELRISFTHGAITQLKEHSWPGNIRELKNLVVRAKTFYSGESVTAEMLTRLIEESPVLTSDITGEEHSKGNLIKEFERQMIMQRLLANQGNQRQTALDLGIPKSTLHDRLRSYGINMRDVLKNIKASERLTE